MIMIEPGTEPDIEAGGLRSLWHISPLICTPNLLSASGLEDRSQRWRQRTGSLAKSGWSFGVLSVLLVSHVEGVFIRFMVQMLGFYVFARIVEVQNLGIAVWDFMCSVFSDLESVIECRKQEHFRSPPESRVWLSCVWLRALARSRVCPTTHPPTHVPFLQDPK